MAERVMTHRELIMSIMPAHSMTGWRKTGEIQARIYHSGYERLSRHNLARALADLIESGKIEKRRAGRYSEYRRI